MKSYKAIDILKTFTSEDIKRFRDFLNSPFFNKSAKLVKFYEALITFHPAFDSKFLNDERLLKKLNPDLPFNKSTILNLFSDLAESAEKYFVQLCLQRREVQSIDFLRNELFKRELNKGIEINITKSQKLLKGVTVFDESYFLNHFDLVTDMINIQVVNKNKSSGSVIKHLDEMHSDRGRYNTYFFVQEMIRGFDNLLTLDRNFMLDKNNNFIFKVFKEVNFENLLNLAIADSANKEYIKIFEIYLAFFLLFSEFENEKHYYKYKKLVLSNLKSFSLNDIRSHFIRLIRYCMMKSAKDKQSDKFNKELFDIYRYILKNEYYKCNLSKYMPVELYRMILLLSLKMNKYKWALEFIKNYKSKLSPDKRENMYHYSWAEYYFSRGKFTEAMKNFHKVKLDHFMLKLDLKNLMLMTYYELELFENALSCIDAYKHFLSNDKTLSQYEKLKDKNFINIINLMIKYRQSGCSDDKFKIEKELNNDLPYKGWVKEKISQLDMKYDKSA